MISAVPTMRPSSRSSCAVTAVFVAAVTCAAGCGTSKAVGQPRGGSESAPPPEWITGRTPAEEGCVFAVGTSGPTFDPEDARRFALDDARVQLATTLSARVQALVVDVQTTGGGWSDSANVIETQQWATDTVLTGGEVVASWIDEYGQVGRRGTAYALGKLNLRNPTVRKTPPPLPPPKTVGDVQMNAEKAFEALEAEEATKHSGN